MANTKISEMEEASSVSSNDILPIVQGGSNKKVTLKTLSGTVQGMLVPDSIPIGTVVEFASDTNIPENWLLCNGQEVSRTEYDLLFAIIGTTWGEGDGSTTFNVPTKEGLVTVGKKSSDTAFNTIGKTGGEKTHTLTVDEMPSHNHGMKGRENGTGMGDGYPLSANDYVSVISSAIIQNNGGNQPHNNLQPYITSNFIIKAKQSSGVVATVVDSLKSDSSTDALSAKQGKMLGTYSLNETVVGTWLDGKPIYRKAFKLDKALFGEQTVNINHGISNLDIVTNIRGLWKTDDGARRAIPSSYFGTLDWASQINANDTQLIFEVGSLVAAKLAISLYGYVYVIMEYTKTTD